MERVPPPWVVKPRSDVSSSGIRNVSKSRSRSGAPSKRSTRARLCRTSPPTTCLRSSSPGEVFHVDSVVEEGEVIFSGASRYGRPPLDVAQGGGVFIDPHARLRLAGIQRADAAQRRAAPRARPRARRGARRVHQGRRRTASSTFSKSPRASAALTSRRLWRPRPATTSGASGRASRWRARAASRVGRLEPRREYGGIALSLARQERPDTSAYDDPEIVFRVDKPHHVGLVVRSPDLARVRRASRRLRASASPETSAPPSRRPSAAG